MSIANLARLVALAFVSLMFLVVPVRAADPVFPELNGRRVVDDARILSASQQASLTQKLADLEARNTDQVVVVTVPSLQNTAIEDYGYKLGRKWGIGQQDVNNGVILLVAPTEHKVRIEVGYGVEDVMTDAYSSIILQEKVLPRFKEGDYPAGIDAGVDAIIAQLSLDEPQALARIAAAEAEEKRKSSQTAFWFLVGVGVFVALTLFGPLLLSVLIPQRYRPAWLASGGGWSGGGGGGFSGGGGGFSGGGGSFGGGGASGSW
jgi:uncharacterized protein